MTDERQSALPEARRQEAGGVMRVTTGSLKVPAGLDAEEAAVKDNISTVVVVVVAVALAYIAFIAWLIHGGQ